MRVGHIVARVMGELAQQIHPKRLTAILVVIDGIVRAGRLSLTTVGRALRSRARIKYSIKRVDRLLGNQSFRAERWLQFNAICRYLLGDARRPVIVVDWTKVVGEFQALYAAVPVGGRAQPLYFEVHPERRMETARVHARFLRNLRDVLPTGCRPILVTDAGFHGPFFREVLRLGWDYVGRLRGRTTMRKSDRRRRTNVCRLYRRAATTATDLGAFKLYRKVQSLDARLVLVRRPRSVAHPWRRRLSADHSSTMRAGKDPWLLVTSLSAESAATVVRLYSLRMQIEESFRDTKNHRFGWALRDVRSSSVERLEALLLLSVLAMLAVTLIGMATERRGLQRWYQANTVTHRVLSHFVLGMAVTRAHAPPKISPTDIAAVVAAIHATVVNPAEF
jgi:Transposase DDE domain